MRFSSAMESIVDRAAARQHLELANKQVADSHRRVEAQVGLVARLARGGTIRFRLGCCLGSSRRRLPCKSRPAIASCKNSAKATDCEQMIFESALDNCSSGGRGLR